MKQFYFLFVFNILIQLGIWAKGEKTLKLENKQSLGTVDTNYIKKLFVNFSQIRYQSKDSLITQGKIIFNLSKKINWSYGIASSSERIGRVYWSVGQYDSALFYHYISLNEFKKLNYRNQYWKDYWDVVVMIGQDYANASQYDKSIIYLNAALHEYQDKKVEGGVTYVLSILSWVYSSKGDYVTSSQILYEKIKIEEKNKDSVQIMRAYLDLITNNLDLKKFDEAEKLVDTWSPFVENLNNQVINLEFIIDKARIAESKNQKENYLNLREKEKIIAIRLNDNYWIADAFAAIGHFYSSEHDYKTALKDYDSAHYYYNSYDQKKELVSVDCNRTKCYLKIGDITSAGIAINEASKYIQTFDSDVSKLEFYEAKYLYDSAAKNWPSAFKYLQLYHSLSDVLFNQANTQQLLELKIKHESDKRENTLKAKNDTFFWFLMALALVTISILGFFIVLYIKNNKLKRYSEIQNAMLHEIHHRVKNNLQLVSGFMQLQLNKTSDSKGREALEESINNINVVSLVHENLYSKASDLVNLKNYIPELCTNIKSISESLIHPEIKLQCEEIFLSIDQTIPVGLIINELITNSVKHAFKNLTNHHNIIEITISAQKNLIQIYYADNGIGYESENLKKSSIGIKLIKMLTQELQGKYTMSGINGFRFELDFRKK
ncbi:MAG: tetratricopeptide repeat-containing sensor histidine kinase [Bacteroidia bacterium]